MDSDRGSIIPRGDKFLVRIYVGRIDGKRKYKSKMEDTKEDAERRLTEMLRKKDRGVLDIATKEKLDEFCDEWLESKRAEGKAPATIENYKNAVESHIKPELGHLKLDEVNSRLVQMWINQLSTEKGLAPGTVRLYHTTLRQILQYAVVTEMIAFNPAEGSRVTLPRRRKKHPEVWTKEEVSKFLEATAGDRYHALWALRLFTGLRNQEAAALKWEDIEDGWLEVRRVVRRAGEDADRQWEVSEYMKNEHSRRRIKLPPSLVSILGRHRRRQAREMLEYGERFERRGFIFTNHEGRWVDPQQARRHFKDALEDVEGVKEIPMHNLRHTHISHLIIDGVDLKKASARAGHSTIKTTADTYAHIDKESEEEMASVIEQGFGRASGGES